MYRASIIGVPKRVPQKRQNNPLLQSSTRMIFGNSWKSCVSFSVVSFIRVIYYSFLLGGNDEIFILNSGTFLTNLTVNLVPMYLCWTSFIRFPKRVSWKRRNKPLLFMTCIYLTSLIFNKFLHLFDLFGWLLYFVLDVIVVANYEIYQIWFFRYKFLLFSIPLFFLRIQFLPFLFVSFDL